jgi:hypothetical protein
MPVRMMPVESKWLRASVSGAALSPIPRASGTAVLRDRLDKAEFGRSVGVDKEKRILKGYILAQAGPFKSPGRGEFDSASLQSIVKLGNAAPGGLKSRFTHPDMSSDGLGKHLGRAKNLSLSYAQNAAGQTVQCVRGDLHFANSASRTPSGDLAGYILSLADEDSDALSSSLALQVEKEYRVDADGRALTDDDGEELPPLWRPTKIHASDIVGEGDACDGILGAGTIDVDSLPRAALWKADALLDSVFAGQPVAVIESRLRAWMDRYIERLRGTTTPPRQASSPDVDRRRRRLQMKERAGASASNTDSLRRLLRLREHEARC